MNVDSSYFLDQKVNAYVQTLGFTGVERSSGSPITVGGISIPTPSGNGTNAGYWNNLLAAQVAQTLGQASNFSKFVIDVKDNTVILISPSTVNSEKLELINGSNSSIGMTVNAPSGWVNGFGTEKIRGRHLLVVPISPPRWCQSMSIRLDSLVESDPMGLP